MPYEPMMNNFVIANDDIAIIPLDNAPFDYSRQSVIISQEPIGIFDEHSIFAFPVFIPTEELRPVEERIRIHSRFTDIYRTVYPWDREEGVFEILSQKLNNESRYITRTYINDTLLSFLLTEESIYLSDKELLERLSDITNVYIFSKNMDSKNYRLIGINHDTEKVFRRFNETWSYFIQVWDDDHIWAQPLMEGTEYIFGQAVFMTMPGKDGLVILNGYTRSPPGNGIAMVGTGFTFEGGIWTPIVWNEMFEEVYLTTGLRIGSDGILSIIFPASWGVPHEGPRYFLKLKEDGSFWADYSMSGMREDTPSSDLLFRLKTCVFK